ncbi:diacylglycerol/lipid kinase family protein [Mycobacteroides abscessus]|uniref:diacylglycerol/lipid kinase family protein n=1 Tax=Mycobacteroides abscessus TaxID=36809 RepID=UPI0013FCF907|nr:diacylglycerol kinase family protein [Mycobacteroides abscessus]
MSNRLRVAVIVNPAAGGDAHDVVAALQQHPVLDLRVLVTSKPGDAERLSVEQCASGWPQVVVAVGGDGTAGQVAAALYSCGGPALLVAPAGTGNSTYRGLCDDRPWASIVNDLARGMLVRKTIDLALIAEIDQIVLLGSTSGLLPSTLVHAQTMQGSGRSLLSDATVAALETHKPFSVRITVDGNVVYDDVAFGTYVGGMRYRGGKFEMLPESMLDDGLLDLCALDPAGPPHYARGANIAIERTDGQPLLIEFDGELCQLSGSTCTVRALPHALGVLVPQPLPAALSPLLPVSSPVSQQSMR